MLLPLPDSERLLPLLFQDVSQSLWSVSKPLLTHDLTSARGQPGTLSHGKSTMPHFVLLQPPLSTGFGLGGTGLLTGAIQTRLLLDGWRTRSGL